jgi:hypothetical protein
LLTISSCFLDESAPIGLVAFAVLELAAGVANRALNFANSDQAFLLLKLAALVQVMLLLVTALVF